VTSTVDQVLSGRPAATMGLSSGDRIIAINFRPVQAREIVPIVSTSNGRPLRVTVIRDGEALTLGPARARAQSVNGKTVYRLGFALRGAHLGVADASWRSLKLIGVVSRETIKSLGGIVHKKGRDQLSSPVGIVRESAAQARHGWQDYLLVLGFISLSLALL